jgi:hypothetical protein
MTDPSLHVRLYPEEKQTIRERAAHYGLTVSEYVRRLVVVEQRQSLYTKAHPQGNVDTIGDR